MPHHLTLSFPQPNLVLDRQQALYQKTLKGGPLGAFLPSFSRHHRQNKTADLLLGPMPQGDVCGHSFNPPLPFHWVQRIKWHR